MWEMIKAGGPILLFILLISVVAIFFGIRRLLENGHARSDMSLFEEVGEHIKTKNWKEALGLCDARIEARKGQLLPYKGVVPKLLSQGLSSRGGGLRAVQKTLAEEFRLTVLPAMRKYLSPMLTVAKLSPMLGLFGTVVGMMMAFQKIAAKVKVNPQELADNIGLALVTTAGGLLVAIPIIIWHTILKASTHDLELEIQKGMNSFLDDMASAEARKRS